LFCHFGNPRLISTSPIPIPIPIPIPLLLRLPDHRMTMQTKNQERVRWISIYCFYPSFSSRYIASQPITPQPFRCVIRYISRFSCTSWMHAACRSTCLKIQLRDQFRSKETLEMTAESFANSDLPSFENRLQGALGRPQDQPLSSMSHSAADVVASADTSCESHSTVHHQSPSKLHDGHHDLTTRHPPIAAQTPGSDGKLATANPVLSAPRLIAYEALDLVRSLKSHTMPSPPFEASFVIGGPATQFGQSEEPTRDMSMVICPCR
jgi:hypothetical protein